MKRSNTKNSKQLFPENEVRGNRSQFPNSCVSERFVYSNSTIDLPILLQEIRVYEYVDRSREYINRSQRQEIETEAVQFPEKEYINGIFVKVYIFHHFLYHSSMTSAMTGPTKEGVTYLVYTISLVEPTTPRTGLKTA
jgi:hypothetical protein